MAGQGSELKKRVLGAHRKVNTPRAKDDTRRKRLLPTVEELAEAAAAAYVARHAQVGYPPV